MTNPVTAEDLLPIVVKLSPQEQVRLARMAMREAERASPQDAMNLHEEPVRYVDDSFKDDAQSWEGYGWDAIDTPH